jgi:xylose isomerase
MDALAEGLLLAAEWIEAGRLQAFVTERYQGWDDGLGREILAGKVSLDELWRRARVHGAEPQPRSGRQELLESWTRPRRR